MRPSTVPRSWAARVLKPPRVRSFWPRTDPWCAEKRAELLTLYLHPPRGCRILCLDEQPPSQALERLPPTLPLRPDLVERQEFE
jgi:hypothetical protein